MLPCIFIAPIKTKHRFSLIFVWPWLFCYNHLKPFTLFSQFCYVIDQTENFFLEPQAKTNEFDIKNIQLLCKHKCFQKWQFLEMHRFSETNKTLTSNDV